MPFRTSQRTQGHRERQRRTAGEVHGLSPLLNQAGYTYRSENLEDTGKSLTSTEWGKVRTTTSAVGPLGTERNPPPMARAIRRAMAAS